MQDEATVQCPHCFEILEISIDVGGGAAQEFIIDCEVCCRPMTIRAEIDAEAVWILASAD